MAVYLEDVKDKVSNVVARLSEPSLNDNIVVRKILTVLYEILNCDDFVHNDEDYYSDYAWKANTKIGKMGVTSEWGYRNYEICVYEYDDYVCKLGEINLHKRERINCWDESRPTPKVKQKVDIEATVELYYNSLGNLKRLCYIEGDRRVKIDL